MGCGGLWEDIMIVEHTYDNRKICYGCTWLVLDKDGMSGRCECKDNRIRERQRHITDRRCVLKRLVVGFGG